MSLYIKRYLFWALVLLIAFAPISWAQTREGEVGEIKEDSSAMEGIDAEGGMEDVREEKIELDVEEVTNKDLGIETPGVLPSNPLYFLKEFSRNVRRKFVFDPVERVELELDIVNEKVAEIDFLEEVSGDPEVLGEAVDNYSVGVDRLRVELEKIREDSGEFDEEEVAYELALRSKLHQQFLSGLENRQPILKGKIETVRGNLGQLVGNVFGVLGDRS